MKSPAFQFYVNDFLGSAKVGMMSTEEIGAYLLLLLLDWSHASLDIGGRLQALTVELDGVRDHLVLGVVVAFHLNLKSRHQSGDAHLLLASVEQAGNVFHGCGVIEYDHHIATVRCLYGHGGAPTPVDHSLKFGVLRRSTFPRNPQRRDPETGDQSKSQHFTRVHDSSP